jgi:DNA adenine methylase
MHNASPLRYPGGKASLTSVLKGVLEANQFGNRQFVEPFAGGAGAALSLLFQESVTRVHLNDLDAGVFAFWWSVLNRSDAFIKLVRKTPATMAQWKQHKANYKLKRQHRLGLGFSTFFLNRCNHSGIIDNGGPIGGRIQQGGWKVDARYNQVELVRRLERIASFRERITVSRQDACRLIEQQLQIGSFLFIDPPYYHKGQALYLNALDHAYHARLAEVLHAADSNAWVLTYDDCPEIRKLYRSWANVQNYSLRYSAAVRRQASELFITPKGLFIPRHQSSKAVIW